MQVIKSCCRESRGRSPMVKILWTFLSVRNVGKSDNRSDLLPARFSYARDLALVSEFAEADTADAVFTKVSMRSAADLAACVLSCGELLLSLLL